MKQSVSWLWPNSTCFLSVTISLVTRITWAPKRPWCFSCMPINSKLLGLGFWKLSGCHGCAYCTAHSMEGTHPPPDRASPCQVSSEEPSALYIVNMASARQLNYPGPWRDQASIDLSGLCTPSHGWSGGKVEGNPDLPLHSCTPELLLLFWRVEAGARRDKELILYIVGGIFEPPRTSTQ